MRHYTIKLNYHFSEEQQEVFYLYTHILQCSLVTYCLTITTSFATVKWQLAEIEMRFLWARNKLA